MDIVESLRRAAGGASYSDPMRGVLFTCDQAADEIEKLRKLLGSCRKAMDIGGGGPADWRHMIAAIDSALKE